MENMELLKAIKELIDSHHERMLAVQLKMIASQEQMMDNMYIHQAKMDAVHKEIMVKLDAHQERMEAWQEEMKAV
jgi:TRAP-type mannitol/chloroaromatic compound transport system substrate-binding protein